MGSKKENEIFNKVWEQIHMECSISCQKCKKTVRKYNVDEYDFATGLIQNNWTFKRNLVICDDCSKNKK